jgi:hypothetical protein
MVTTNMLNSILKAHQILPMRRAYQHLTNISRVNWTVHDERVKSPFH